MLYEEFINRLFETFTNSWKMENRNILDERYKKALNNPRIDFEKLDNWINNEWKSSFIPSPAELKEASVKCYKVNPRGEFIHVKAINPVTEQTATRWCFPKETSYEKIIETLNKYEPLKDQKNNTVSWEIVQIY